MWWWSHLLRLELVKTKWHWLNGLFCSFLFVILNITNLSHCCFEFCNQNCWKTITRPFRAQWTSKSRPESNTLWSALFFNATCSFLKNREKRPRKRELSKHSFIKRVKKKFKVLTALRCSQFEQISDIVLTVVTYLHKIKCWYNERGLSNQQHS